MTDDPQDEDLSPRNHQEKPVRRFPYGKAVIEVHASDASPLSKRPLLKVFAAGSYSPVVELELSDFCGMAQTFFELELTENLGQSRDSAYFKRRVKALRKALGYSYP